MTDPTGPGPVNEPREMTTPTPGKRLDEATIASIDDPWIRAYLRFREAVLDNRFATEQEADEFLRAETSGLPGQSPSIPAATFISADIAITFPETSSPKLLAGLWAPQDLPTINHGLLALHRSRSR